ncbi:MAG TPA: hypothetical protein VJ924_04265, partial [Alphaproteobacteria bacterium]|nr:hypothetical protein [Alphaproteobacteria bacterium]
SYLERRAMFHFFSPLYEERIRPIAASTAGIQLPGWNWDHLVFGPVTSKRVLAQLIETVGERPAGSALFAHLILPHNTYLYDARCETNPDFLKWVDRNRTVFWPFISNTPEDRAQRYVRYFEQLRCTYGMLDALFDAMRERGTLDRAMIFVHGDHGSRIALTDPLPQLADRLTKQDVIDGYSTLYAVRLPGAGSSVSTETRSIQDLFAEHALGEPPRAAFRRVYLVSLPKWRLQPLDIYANEFDLEREQGGQHASQR